MCFSQRFVKSKFEVVEFTEIVNTNRGTNATTRCGSTPNKISCPDFYLSPTLAVAQAEPHGLPKFVVINALHSSEPPESSPTEISCSAEIHQLAFLPFSAGYPSGGFHSTPIAFNLSISGSSSFGISRTLSLQSGVQGILVGSAPRRIASIS